MDRLTTQTAEMTEETRQIQRVALFAFLLNLVLAGLKVVLAVVSGSLAVTAGAIDSLTDSFTSVAVYAGVKLSTRQFKHFPLGLYKIENLISVVIAFFIFFVGYEIARRIIMGDGAAVPEISLWVIVLLAFSTVVTFLFGQYALRVGRKTESPTLIAEGHHRRADVLSSLVVFFSVVMSFLDIQAVWWGMSIDHMAAGVVLVFICMAGWRLLSDGMRVLLDASVDFETLETVREIISSEPAVADIISLVGRNSGRFRFIQAAIVLRTDDLKKAHKISDRIEARIHTEVPHVGRVMIHYEPHEPEFCRVALPMADTETSISDHFGDAPYFVIYTLDRSQRQILEKKFEKNPFQDQAQGKGIQVAEWLISHGVDEVVVYGEIQHKGPGYVFANAGIATRRVDTNDLNRAVADICR